MDMQPALCMHALVLLALKFCVTSNSLTFLPGPRTLLLLLGCLTQVWLRVCAYSYCIPYLVDDIARRPPFSGRETEEPWIWERERGWGREAGSSGRRRDCGWDRLHVKSKWKKYDIYVSYCKLKINMPYDLKVINKRIVNTLRMFNREKASQRV